jgi:hypothetical protein
LGTIRWGNTCWRAGIGWAGIWRGRVAILATVALWWSLVGQARTEAAPANPVVPAEETTPAMASSRIPEQRLQQYSDLALAWMQQYLRIDTTNPPGHEMRAAAFYKKIFEQEGIENRVFEYTPGRGDLWARLPHTTAQAQRPIILLNHMDVVTSDAAHWKVPPFNGEIKDGWLWGRGAQDMKDEGWRNWW